MHSRSGRLGPDSGPRPSIPAPGIWHLASGLRLGTRSPDSRSVDAAPIRVSGGRFNSSAALFLYPSPCPRQLHPCSASVHRLPRPPVLSALFCLPSFRYFTSSLVRAARRPLRAASCRLALLIACRRALFPTSCRHLVSPSFCASVPPSFCASARLPPDAFFPLFLGASPLPRTNTPRYVIPRKGRRLFRSGPAHKTKKPKICSLVVIYSPFRLNIC